MLTPRFHFQDVRENNQTTTFFHSLNLTQLYMTTYIIQKTLKHNKALACTKPCLLELRLDSEAMLPDGNVGHIWNVTM